MGPGIIEPRMSGWNAWASCQKWRELQRAQACQKQGVLTEKGPPRLGAAMERGAFYQSTSVSCFSRCCDKIHSKSNSQEKEFVLSQSSRIQVINVKKSWEQGYEAVVTLSP